MSFGIAIFLTDGEVDKRKVRKPDFIEAPLESRDLSSFLADSAGSTADHLRGQPGGTYLPQIFSRCGINIVRHLQAPPALMNSVIGNS